MPPGRDRSPPVRQPDGERRLRGSPHTLQGGLVGQIRPFVDAGIIAKFGLPERVTPVI